MKSIIEEASTVTKAIEQAWSRAGQPAQFSVKIFQLPEKNFFGMTTKSAKIGIIFTDPKPEPRARKEKRKPVPTTTDAPQSKKRAIKKPAKKDNKEQETKTASTPATTWSDTMIQFVEQFIKESITAYGFTNITFSHTVTENLLKITFDTPIIESSTKEKQFFQSYSYLIMSALRNAHHTIEGKRLRLFLARK